MPDDYDDDGADSLVEVRRRRPRRKPRLKRKRRDLEFAPGTEPADKDVKFADADMQALYLRGYFDTLIGEVKEGKEATLFLVGRGDERLAAKVYADIDARSFRDDSSYWTDVYIGDTRLAKAMRQGSRAGKQAKQTIWAMREYASLWRLWDAGLPVPKPALGPEPSVYAEAGSVVLMEFLGEGDAPAPRLADGHVPTAAVGEAFRQSVDILRRMAAKGWVHGDFSTYNLLWHQGRVWAIDVPQMVPIEGNRNAIALLERDVRSLVTSFRKLGHEADEGAVMRSVLGAVKRD